jgi:hypothetical protein
MTVPQVKSKCSEYVAAATKGDFLEPGCWVIESDKWRSQDERVGLEVDGKSLAADVVADTQESWADCER